MYMLHRLINIILANRYNITTIVLTSAQPGVVAPGAIEVRSGACGVDVEVRELLQRAVRLIQVKDAQACLVVRLVHLTSKPYTL